MDMKLEGYEKKMYSIIKTVFCSSVKSNLEFSSLVWFPYPYDDIKCEELLLVTKLEVDKIKRVCSGYVLL